MIIHSGPAVHPSIARPAAIVADGLCRQHRRACTRGPRGSSGFVVDDNNSIVLLGVGAFSALAARAVRPAFDGSPSRVL
jgi:hypothetical protein